MQRITSTKKQLQKKRLALLSLLLATLFTPFFITAQCTTGTDTGYPDFTPDYSGDAQWISFGDTWNGKYYTIDILANRFYTFYAYKTGSAEDGYQEYLTVTDTNGFYLAAGYAPLVFQSLNYTGQVKLYYHTNEACQTNTVNKRLFAMSYTANRWPPTNLSTSNITTTSVTLNWEWNWVGGPPTNGYQYHIIEAPGSFGLPLPPDNNAASAVTGFSLTNTATVSNLNPNKRYCYWVRSNYGGQYSVWMQGGEFMTTDVICNQPTGLTVSNITANSALFTWQAPNPLPSQGYNFAINQSGLEPNASQTTYPLTTSEFISNLSPNTTYYYFVRSDCNVQESAWVLGGTFTTPAGFNCNGAVYGLNPTAVYTPDCTGTAETIVSNAKAGEYSNIAVAANTQYTFNSSITTDYITITNNSGNVLYASGVTPIIWQSGSSNETIRFFLHTNSSCGTNQTLRAKTITCASTTNCLPPSNLASSNIGANQAGISWSASASNPALYEVYFNTTNNAPNAGTTPNGSVATTSATINSLSPSTTYYFWVRSNCSPLTSAWVYGGSFTTTASGSCNTAQYGLYPTATFTPTCSGSAELIANDSWAGEYSNITITSNRTYTFSSSVTTDYITITDSSGATIITSGLSPLSWNSATNNGVFRYYLHAGASCTSQNTNRSRYVSCQNTAPSCGLPSAITFSSITATSANVSWTAATPTPASGYDVYLSTAATAPTAGTVPSGNVNSTAASLSSLTSGTVYYVWIRANCGATQGNWVAGGNFTTATTSGCNTATYGLYPTATYTPACSGTPELIANDSWAGEYSNIAVSAGVSYTFSSSVGTDYITITDGTGTTIVANGVSPLMWNTGTYSGTYRYYLHTNASCGNQNTNRSRYITCQSGTSCALPSNINIVGTSANGGSFLWTAANPAPANGYQYYISTSATAPNAATLPSGSVNQTTLNVFGLNSNTLYYFWLRSNCTPTPGNWVSGGFFTTQGTATFCSTAVYGLYPTATFTPTCSGSNEIIVNNARGGEYTNVSITPNKQYTFSSSVTSDYITITNSNGTALIINGVSPLTWSSGATSGTIRYYLHADSSCSFENANRIRSISCTGSLNAVEAEKKILKAFPNPTGSIITIVAEQIISKIQVINTLGQLLATQSAQTSEVTLDLLSYPKGMYTIQVFTTEGTQKTKVIKL